MRSWLPELFTLLISYYDMSVISCFENMRCVMGDGEVWRRWETSTRYYVVLLHRDLLGDWVLTVAHGGRSNNLGALVHRGLDA